MRISKFHFLFLFLFLFLRSLGQDIHWSQYNASPLNLNPALAGIFDGDQRIIANHRNQWNSVTLPYKTISLSYDRPIAMKGLKNASFGGGIVVNNDKAGDSRMGVFQVNMIFNYIRKMSKDSVHLLSAGLSAGVGQRSFNTTNLSFDDQWNGDSYDPNMSTGENFDRTALIFYDITPGIDWYYKPTQRLKGNLGISFAHVNRPNMSFMNNADISLHPKTTIHAKMQFPVHKEIDVLPSFIYEKQNQYHEFITGASVKYIMATKYGYNSAFYLGTYLRFGDAVILSTGVDFKDFHFGFSYDINTSGLKPASNGRGGFELSLVYILRKFIPINEHKHICPVYL